MEVFALVPFFIMGTATFCGLSLLVCLVVLERDPTRCCPAALPNSKPYRRRKALIGRHAPTARRPTAQGRAPRKTVGPSSHTRQAPKGASGRA
jgi:hypothetical protein